MAIAINEHYLESFIGKVQARYERLDRELQDIAAASQRAYRSDLQPGQTVRDLKRTTVYEERYQEQANDAELRAHHDIEALFDALDRDVAASRSEAAPADAVATVTLALQNDPTDTELRDLWTQYHGNATLRKAIRKAAAKSRIFLPIDPEDAVAENRDEARRYALSRVHGRWSRFGHAELDFVMSAEDSAEDVYRHLMGVDIFGQPIDY